MDESFQLQTTMSPKPLRTKVHIKKPTILALRKNIRRSSCYDKPPAAIVDIYKEEDKEDLKNSRADSTFEDSCVMFSDLSIIPKETSMKAMNSTFMEGRHTQFHELFEGNKKKNNSNRMRLERDYKIATSSFELKDTEVTIECKDSFNVLLNPNEDNVIQTSSDGRENLIKKIDSPLQITPENEKDKLDEIRKVLDDIYGTSWRKRENEVLRTEPRKKVSLKINDAHKAVCQTEIKKINKQKLSGYQSNINSCDQKGACEPHLRSSTLSRTRGRKLYSNVSESDSEDEIFAQRNFRRIVKPKVAKGESLKQKKGSQGLEKKKIENNGEISNSICSEPTSINSERVHNSFDKPCNPDPEVVILSDSSDCESTRSDICDNELKNMKPLAEKCRNVITNNIESLRNDALKVTSKQTGKENDDLNEIRKVLDDIYGSSWRDRENEVLRTEPRMKVSAKNDHVYKAFIKTGVKSVQVNQKNVHSSVTSNEVYIDSPTPIFSIPTKIKEPRTLFPSLDSDDEGHRNTEPVASSKIISSKVKTITLRKESLKYVSNKVSGKSTPKYSWPKDITDSESDLDASVVSGDSSNESDWATPQDDYLPIISSDAKDKLQKRQKTFLESLSKTVPILEAHPTAKIYRDDFKKHRDELTSRLFQLYNDEVFGGVIPSNTIIEWNARLRGTAGYCKNKKLTNRDKVVTRSVALSLSIKVLDSPDRLRDTLIHEMCHAANWIVDGERGHGASWKIWTIKAGQVFPELPPISTRHSYNITTKYAYRCTKCGYSFGRHSKSVAIEKKCCGYCKGGLELLVNKVTKSGLSNNTLVSTTPARKPTAFALYIKDNYKTCRTPDLKHGDVMRLLSKQFKSLKVVRNSFDK